MMDRISHLPDDLLLHILSSKSLQNKDVVATSVLSKRWRSLWYSIPKLEFLHRSLDRYESFLQFVDATLNLVDLKSVKMFVIKFDLSVMYYEVSRVKVDSWLNTVLKRKLEYMNLWLSIGFDFFSKVPLPSTIFKCSSIRILKLAGVHVRDLSDVNLPSLKTLHLMDVEFLNPESLALLLSKCVRLEELLLQYLEFPDDEVTTLNIGKLHNLVIAFVPVELFSMETISNVTFLCLHKNNILGDYEFPKFPTFYNLSHLEIYLCQDGWTSLFSCLPSFPKLETLIIYEDVIKGLDWLLETSPDVPLCISSHLKTFALFGFKRRQSEFKIVRFIMKNATVLRSVKIWTGYYSSHEAEINLLETLSSYPKCSQNCSIFVDVHLGSLYQEVYSKLVPHKDFSYYFEVDKSLYAEKHL